MKKTLLFLTALFVFVFSFGQTVIYEQDFNAATLPTQWFLQQEGSGTYEWSFGSGTMPGSVANFTSNAAIFDDDAAGDTGNHNVALLCYPYTVGELDLTPYIGMHVEMEYEYALSVLGTGEEALEFLVYDDTTGDWITVKTYNDDTDPTLEKIDVTQLMIEHAGIDMSNFYFAFRYDDIDSGWAFGAGIDNVKFTAYNPPANDTCGDAELLNVGHDFNHYAIETTLEHATATEGEDFRNTWYSFDVPDSGNVTIETDYAPGSAMHDTFLMVYSGSCGSLTFITLDDDSGNGEFARIVLTGQTPGNRLTVQVQDDMDSTDPLDTFLLSVYDVSIPAAPVNDLCNSATNLIVGNNFGENDVIGTLESGTDLGSFYGWRGVWYSCTVPASGNLTIETDYNSGSAMHDTYLVALSGNCGALNLVSEDDDNGNNNFSKMVLTGLTPGDILIIEVEEDADSSEPLDSFLISAYSTGLSTEDTVIEGFTMYPNPVENQLNLSAINVISDVVIYNILGESVLEINPNDVKTSIDVSNLSTGPYVVKIHSANQIGAYKLIKQ